jgi:hypothetical protein
LKLLDLHSNFVFNTYSFRPAVFSSANDNTVGDVIAGSTGTPSTNGLATYLFALNTTNSNVLIEHARFSYAGTAFWSQADWSHVFRHCQFVQCVTNVALLNDIAVSFQNVLAANCSVMLAGYSVTVDGENMTVDSCNKFAVTSSPYWGFYNGGLTNCVLTAVDNSVTNFTFKDTARTSTSTGVYQTVGAAGYYLASGSVNRDAGTSTINATLLADLQTMTTYPPVVVAPGFFTNNYTFFPQAQRDTDVLDCGFHYDPIDFAIDMCVSNATVTVLPGTVLAGYAGNNGGNYGIWTCANGIINCTGTPTSPNYLVQYNTVQEQSNTNWSTTNWAGLLITPFQSDSSSVNFGFTSWSVLSDLAQIEGEGSAFPFVLQNCQFYGGIISGGGPQVCATNCLFHRVNFSVRNAGSGNIAQTYENNLFLAGTVSVRNPLAAVYTFRDNLFDQTAVSLVTGTINYCSNNAYVTTNNGFLSPTNGDTFLTASPAYQTGALGVYYYPTNLTLIHTGSQLAAVAGLYHYAVLTNNTIEGTNIVSIGFHYVAVGSNGLPLDTNGDGIPDYLEDANGNGLVDSGEINWMAAGDLGLTVIITQPMNNSTIP